MGYGYDDLGRLVEFDCGSGNWGQQFAYDQYDNLTKTVLSGRTGTTWNPGYPSSNQCTGCTYDSNGDVTGDGNDVYGWNEFSKLKWTTTSGTPTCGTSGRCATYDAFGRMVEASVNSTWHTYWYTQAGKIVMTGTTSLYGRWPTSSGTAETVGTLCCAYLHSDWLGNSKIVSSTSNNTVTADQAYTPYGEIYNIFGANNGQYQVFADTIADLAPSTTTPIMWDTPNRELSYAGRFLSPDPAGSGWNQYAYPTNPNSNVDPSGLCTAGGGGSGETNNCPPAWMSSNCPQPGPGGCELFYGGGGGCYDLDNSGQCAPQGLQGSDAGVACPNNVCNGVNSNGQYVQFYAFAGGTSGYFNPSDLAQGVWEWNGQLLTAAGWQQLTQSYSDQMKAMLAAILGVDPSSLTALGLTGGNADFRIDQVTGDSFINSDSSCQAGPSGTRCGDDGLHFTQQYDQSGQAGWDVHMDSADAYNFPFGTLWHFVVDIAGGYTIFQTGVPH